MTLLDDHDTFDLTVPVRKGIPVLTMPPLSRPSWPPPRPATPVTSRLAAMTVRNPAPLPAAPVKPAKRPLVGPAVVLTLPMRVFLAVGWLRAGVEKLIDGHWWNGDKLHAFLDRHQHDSVGFWRPFLDVVDRMAPLVAFIVMATEIIIGIAIGLGVSLRAALRWGVLLNVVFVAAGEVNPSAFYLVMEIAMLAAIADGVIGNQPTRPSSRSLWLAAACFASALVYTPYVHDIEPAGMIHDPALMLSFVSLIGGLVLVVRYWADREPLEEVRRSKFLQRFVSWAHAGSADSD
jgi:uncharacterized membrane protein YphA (DoxX/SURF4 family)